jgi:predicted  nucleic acid-binding Zn-ribbon protein
VAAAKERDMEDKPVGESMIVSRPKPGMRSICTEKGLKSNEPQGKPITTSRTHPGQETEIAALKTQLEEANDEAKEYLNIIKKLKEELDSQFLDNHRQKQLLQRQSDLLHRAEHLIKALLEQVENWK